VLLGISGAILEKYRKLLALLFAATLTTQTFAQSAPARNIILFLGDGTGVSSLNAASIYGYNKPQALYIQSFPWLALADTSTATQWVTDGAAGATAFATGVKTNNAVVSQSASAVKGKQDGEILKTFFEYAKEHGLATGAVSNDERIGVAEALTAAFFAHENDRSKAGEIFEQIVTPHAGEGLDVAISGGRKEILKQTAAMGHDAGAELKSHGYAFVDSLEALQAVDPSQTRVIMLDDDQDMPIQPAVDAAIAHLSNNPKGFALVVFSDCHTGKTRTSLQRIVELDNVVREVAQKHKNDSLILWTADHSYDLRIKGETLTETLKKNEGKKITAAVSLEDEHTAEEVPVLAIGPGSERVHGYISNTDVFHIMMAAPGWEQPNIAQSGGSR
jgi:alkaline phosphatase